MENENGSAAHTATNVGIFAVLLPFAILCRTPNSFKFEINVI